MRKLNKVKSTGGLYFSESQLVNLTDDEKKDNAIENSLHDTKIVERNPERTDGNYYNMQDTNPNTDREYDYKQFDTNDLNKQITELNEYSDLKNKKDQYENQKKLVDLERKNLEYENIIKYNQRSNNLETLLNRNLLSNATNYKNNVYDRNKENRLTEMALNLLPKSTRDSYFKSEVEKRIESIIIKQLENEKNGSKEKSEQEILKIIQNLLRKTTPAKKKSVKKKSVKKNPAKKKSVKKKSVKKKSVKKNPVKKNPVKKNPVKKNPAKKKSVKKKSVKKK